MLGHLNSQLSRLGKLKLRQAPSSHVGKLRLRGQTPLSRTRDQTLNLGRKERAGKSPPSPPCYCHPGPASVSLPSQMVRTLIGDSFQPPSGPHASCSARISLIRLCAGPPAHNQPQGWHVLLCCVSCPEKSTFLVLPGVGWGGGVGNRE